jgi:hypothetical protein
MIDSPADKTAAEQVGENDPSDQAEKLIRTQLSMELLGAGQPYKYPNPAGE